MDSKTWDTMMKNMVKKLDKDTKKESHSIWVQNCNWEPFKAVCEKYGYSSSKVLDASLGAITEAILANSKQAREEKTKTKARKHNKTRKRTKNKAS